MTRVLSLLACLFVAGVFGGQPVSAAPNAGVFGSNAGFDFDYVVNVDGSTNGCGVIQAAINAAQAVINSTANSTYSIHVTGKFTFDQADTHVMYYWKSAAVQTDGPYRYCFGILPTGDTASPAYQDGRPVVDGTTFTSGNDGVITIFWDNVVVRFDATAGETGGTAQTVPIVGYVRGAAFTNGTTGGVYSGGEVRSTVNEYGQLTFTRNGVRECTGAAAPIAACNLDYTDNSLIPRIDEATFTESTLTYVAMFDNFATRNRVTDTVYSFRGLPTDDDDIGYLSLEAVGQDMDNAHFTGFTTAALFYGRQQRTFSNTYMRCSGTAGKGVVLGDNVLGTTGVTWNAGANECITGNCGYFANAINVLNFDGGIIEACPQGLILAPGGGHGLTQFENMNLENSCNLGAGSDCGWHNINIGLGSCSGAGADADRMCNADADCTGTCEQPSQAATGISIAFPGTTLREDEDDATYDALYIGMWADIGANPGFIDLSRMAKLGSSGDGAAAEAVFGAETTLGGGVEHPHIILDPTNWHREAGIDMLLPAYEGDFVFPQEVMLTHFAQAAGGTVGQCMRLHRGDEGGTTVNCASTQTSGVFVPAEFQVTRWTITNSSGADPNCDVNLYKNNTGGTLLGTITVTTAAVEALQQRVGDGTTPSDWRLATDEYLVIEVDATCGTIANLRPRGSIWGFFSPW